MNCRPAAIDSTRSSYRMAAKAKIPEKIQQVRRRRDGSQAVPSTAKPVWPQWYRAAVPGPGAPSTASAPARPAGESETVVDDRQAGQRAHQGVAEAHADHRV